MTAMLHVGLGGATAAAAASSATAAQNDQQDAVMKAAGRRVHEAAHDGPNTKGVGAQVLAPKVLPDGTKEFDLTAAIVDWEVVARQDRARPGRTTAPCPGRRSRSNVGDKVQRRARQQAAAVDRRSTSTASRCRTRWTACPTSRSRRSSRARPSPTSSSPQRSRGRHVPLAPPRRGPGARRPARRVHVGDEPLPAGYVAGRRRRSRWCSTTPA